MPYYYRRGYRRRFRLGRRYRRRLYRRSYSRRYVNGSSRSSIRVKTVVVQSSNKTSGHGATLGTVYSITPFHGTSNSALSQSQLYRAYVNLYEEVKLIGLKCVVSVTSVVGNATLPSLEIYTAWDRRHGYGEDDPTADEIKAMASSTVATALNNNVAKISRSIYASDLIEKAQWIDSGVNANGFNSAWVQAAVNPNFFCPAFYMCFGCPNRDSDTQVDFSVSITYYVAFRNPRFGGSSSSKDLPARIVSFADPADDDGDMDDEGDVDEPPAAAAAAPAALERRQLSSGTEAAHKSKSPASKKKN